MKDYPPVNVAVNALQVNYGYTEPNTIAVQSAVLKDNLQELNIKQL